MVSLIFGGNTGIRSPEDLLQRRRAQEALMRSSADERPHTLGEGIAAIARAISGRWGYDALAKEEGRNRDAASARFDALFRPGGAIATDRTGSPDLSAFAQAYSDPWMAPERRSVLQLYIDRETQAADRLRREQLEKNKREIDARGAKAGGQFHEPAG